MCGLQKTGKFLKRWKYQATLPASWETFMQIKKEQLEPEMEQWTGFKLGKEYKRPDAGKDWRQEEKGMTEDEMVGWHRCLNGREFEQGLEDS